MQKQAPGKPCVLNYKQGKMLLLKVLKYSFGSHPINVFCAFLLRLDDVQKSTKWITEYFAICLSNIFVLCVL